MKDIEDILRENPDVFDFEPLPQGHQERFEGKLSRLGEEAAPLQRERKKGKVIRLWGAAGAVAAAIAALCILLPPSQAQNDWFEGVGDDPVAVCTAYSQKAAELCEDIYKRDGDGEMAAMTRGLSDEPVPMIDQLPEEMNPEEKAAVLKKYYACLLDALVTLDKNI